MFGSSKKILRQLERANASLSAIRDDVGRLTKNQLTTVWPMTQALFDRMFREDDKIWQEVKDAGEPEAHGNPYDPAERAHLLEKYRAGTITVDEAGDLSGYLQEDEERARRNQNTGTAVLLLGVIGALAGVGLALAASKREPPKDREQGK
ncbi:MAG: hypothetical protein ACREBT_03975 [Thermoplasmata archaeon]